MNNRLVHVARDGKIIGQYPPEQLAALLDSGHFQTNDLCYSENFPEWIPLPEHLKKVEAPKYSRLSHGESKRPHRHKRPVNLLAPAVLGGWIAFLLALAVLTGAGFWIASLYGTIGEKNDRIEKMVKKIDEQEKENQKLLFATREIAEKGTVRGSFVVRNSSGKRTSVPGAQIFLFSRKTIENYLEKRTEEFSRLPDKANVNVVEFYFSALPTPLATTTADASGRFGFNIPESGEYVICTRVNVQPQGGRLWFVAFNSEDPLNTLVEIDESNSVQQLVPSLMIVEGR